MKWWLILLLAAVGCSTVSPDSSPSAVFSDDVTLVQSACSTVPSKGLDICRFRDGDPITSSWTLYLPWTEDAIDTEVRIKFGDTVRTYKGTDFSMSFNWSEFFGPNWSKKDAGLVQALVTVKYKDRVVQALGYTFIVILKPGYDPVPTSTYGALVYKTCSITYTTSGRSAVYCQ